ncbi:glycosyltransferase family 2 protein [Acetobacter orientalis]|uniref:Glycosyltransferase n=1 Tax=Acetobacter orientalis TaxID=146474 RepID=A0A252A3T7_9PROT|nr:glycosyltransferase family 2 protein [Acetobacter orientalis]OUI83427.1 glycosyltransferase [Acetobacter orientalis]
MSRSSLPTPCLVVVMPCYNEEEVLPRTFGVMSVLLARYVASGLVAASSYVLCVDDGSRDQTWKLISNESDTNGYIQGLKLSRNCGHQNALLAGLSSVPEAQIIVSLDADLQDDPAVIHDMILAWQAGHDVVYGARNDRASDTLFKRQTANVFYKIMLSMGVNIVPNHADFRLLDRVALNALLEYNERNLFLRGLVPLIGFSSTVVYYSRSARLAGESKYPLRKMIGFAVQGITSFSITPLRMISACGLIISLLSVVAILYVIFEKFMGHVVLGWTSVTLAIFFMGGVQMLSLGVIGEYIGKIYLETKNRPNFHVEKRTKHFSS